MVSVLDWPSVGLMAAARATIVALGALALIASTMPLPLFEENLDLRIVEDRNVSFTAQLLVDPLRPFAHR